MNIQKLFAESAVNNGQFGSAQFIVGSSETQDSSH
jgi:hypothetical protein